MSNQEYDITQDEQWYKKKYHPKDILPLCEECGNYYGEYKEVSYGCVHHPIKPVKFNLYRK